MKYRIMHSEKTGKHYPQYESVEEAEDGHKYTKWNDIDSWNTENRLPGAHPSAFSSKKDFELSGTIAQCEYWIKLHHKYNNPVDTVIKEIEL